MKDDAISPTRMSMGGMVRILELIDESFWR